MWKAIRRYFDLNQRIWRSMPNGSSDPYVIPQSEVLEGDTTTGIHAIWEQWLMYLGIVIGVIFSETLRRVSRGEPATLQFTVGGGVIALAIGIFLFPIVYEKLELSAGKPFLYRFGLCIQQGVFWDVVVKSVGGALA